MSVESLEWSESHSVVSDSLWPHRLYNPWNSPGQNTGVGRFSLLQGIFPTQQSNPGLPHCRWILYQLSHKGSPRIPERGLSLLQGIFPTQELNRGLLHCRWIPYQLSHQGSPESLEGISQNRGCGRKAATHALLLLSPRDGSTSSLQICAGLGTNSDQLPAGETTLETPQWGLKDVLTSTPPSWCSKSNAPWAYQPHGTGKPARAEEPSQYPALRAELMFGANSDIRPSCHLSEPKGDQQKKSPLKESWRIINHCSNNKSGDGLIPWTWRKTTERDIFSIPREYIYIIPSVRHYWREAF